MAGFVSLVAMLQRHAQDVPEQIALRYVTKTGDALLTYAQLDTCVRSLATVLQQRIDKSRPRALILLSPGLDYVVAFLACLYAGVIAIPIYPPRKNQRAERVFAILEDSQASLVITTDALMAQFSAHHVVCLEEYATRFEYASGGDSHGVFANEPVGSAPFVVDDPEQIAFFQYTSGSTSTPKGVLVSHRNIMSNLQVIASVIPYASVHKICSWLPPYHDMGLIGCILSAFYMRTELILLSPAYFLQAPLRWLSLMSEHQVTLSAAPNFAFDLCVEKIKDEELVGLDLSHVKCIFNGSEPIQTQTAQRFLQRFAPCGFPAEALYACYGLAEATLLLTTKPYMQGKPAVFLDKKAFEAGTMTVVAAEAIDWQTKTQSTVSIVNCGRWQPQHDLQIVDPKTHQVLPDGEVGEIWASGPSIAKGYWNQPAGVANAFDNRLIGSSQRYLRTSDLGFIYQGELYVTGRISDKMILRGRNYYPYDIERVASQAHPAFEFQRGAAFSIEVDGVAQLVLLQEVRRDYLRRIESEQLLARLRGVLLDQGLMPQAIVLLKPLSLPKTSSGKIQRAVCRRMFLDNTLDAIACWLRREPLQADSQTCVSEAVTKKNDWLADWLMRHMQMTLSAVDDTKTLMALGINSVTAAELVFDLEAAFGNTHDWVELFESSTIAQLTALIEREKINRPTTPVSQEMLTADRRDFRFILESATENSVQIQALKTLYFTVNEGVSAHWTEVDGASYTNFSSYNYLGLSGDAFVTEAAINAVKRYGTSVSASRLVSGEKPLHQQLEQAIAALIGVEDSLVFPSGYATNVTILTHLFGASDLIIHDELAHNSLIQGAKFSGAKRIAFPHNDYQWLSTYLEQYRDNYQRVLIVTEGIFSMDGDIPDIPALLAIKQKFQALLMVDEAHSMGVLGVTGRGIREYFDLDPHEVDIWMGTLSKSFASCGGYVAGTQALINHFKYSAAGFIYSAGISPANTAAALAAIQVMLAEPERVAVLRTRHQLLLSLLQARHIPTGLSHNTPIIPVVVGDDAKALALSQYLKQQSILALPIIYPAVAKNAARLRLFVNCLHTDAQIERTVQVLVAAFQEVSAIL